MYDMIQYQFPLDHIVNWTTYSPLKIIAALFPGESQAEQKEKPQLVLHLHNSSF